MSDPSVGSAPTPATPASTSPAPATPASTNPATAFSVALLGELIRRGVRDVVLSPGSRSQALALAAAAWEQAGRIRLSVRIDERVAGFLALGLAVESATPVVLITTSGTAVANLHPAVLEAHHSGVPLILLTADRPAELRGIGSNQTTDQLAMFGPAIGWQREVDAPSVTGFDKDYVVELAREAYSASAGHSGPVGPVQLDLAFREPLSGVVDSLPELDEHHWPASRAPRSLELAASPHTVIIAGHGAGPEAEAVARQLGVPLLAEVSSGSRFGPNLVVAYRRLLGDAEFGERIERAIVFGHPTLSREIPALLQREGVEAIIVRGKGAEAYNPGHRASQIVDAVTVVGEPDSSVEARAWLGSWVHESRAILDAATPAGSAAIERSGSLAREQLSVFREPVTRRMLVDSVWRTTWPHDRLVFGASRLIRIADGLVGGKRIPVHANRGLAGIDGTIATALGIAIASQGAGGSAAAGVTRLVLGDLAMFYDIGALLLGGDEPIPRIQVIVGNDGGGTIFDDLEVAATAPAAPFDRVLYTPRTVDLGAIARAYGWEYRLVTNRGELDEALAASAVPTIIEVPLPRR